jgi:hypothetical protein
MNKRGGNSSMCFYVDDYAEFASEGVSRARKAQRCCECKSTIAPGERYEWFSGKQDGEFFRLKSCRRCSYDRLRVVEHELAEGCDWEESWPPFGELVGYLKDSGMGQTRPEDVPASFDFGNQPKAPDRQPA